MTIREEIYEKRNREIYDAYCEVNEFRSPKYNRRELSEKYGVSITRIGQIVLEQQQRLDNEEK